MARSYSVVGAMLVIAGMLSVFALRLPRWFAWCGTLCSTGLRSGSIPRRSAFVIESLVPEHAELAVRLSWFLPLGMLQRNPTLKTEMEDFGRASVPLAFFAYPVMHVNDLKERHRRGAVGDVEVKDTLARALNTSLDPIRERRARYEANMDLVRDALRQGTNRA